MRIEVTSKEIRRLVTGLIKCSESSIFGSIIYEIHLPIKILSRALENSNFGQTYEGITSVHVLKQQAPMASAKLKIETAT